MSATRGHQRERAVRLHLESEDWFVCRAAGSLGDADLVALKAGRRPRLIEVKSTAAGPYHSFGPEDRARLLFAAGIAGAVAELAWWPPRGKLRFIPSSEWPVAQRRVDPDTERALALVRPCRHIYDVKGCKDCEAAA